MCKRWPSNNVQGVCNHWPSNNAVLVTLYEILALVVTSVGSKWASSHGVQSNVNFNTPPLPDLGHHWIPYHPSAAAWADGIAILLAVQGLLMLRYCAQPRRLVLAFFSCHSLLLGLRILLILSTVLPSPVPECRSPTAFAASPEYQATAVMGDFYPVFSILPTLYCNDLMFSGHTMTSALLSAFVLLNPSITPLTKGLQILLLAAVIVAVFAARYHYTIDVLVALYSTGTVIAFRRPQIQAFYEYDDDNNQKADDKLRKAYIQGEYCSTRIWAPDVLFYNYEGDSNPVGRV